MTDTAESVPGLTQETPARLDARPGTLPAADLAGAAASVPTLDPLAPYDAVLLLSYGGPRRPEDVLPFMRNATAGRGVPDSRLLEVSGHYQGFGGASPINARNAELRDALQARLAERGSTLPIVVGNRNWHPFVSQALRELADAGARRVLFAGQHRQEEQVRSDLRWQAYARFMGAHGKEPGLLMTCAPDIACAYQQAVAVLREARDRDALPDAVYCAADRTAIGVVLAAQHLGIPVPARMSVLGTGNSQDAEYLDPPLSTIGMTQASIAAVLEHFWRRLSDEYNPA